MWGQFLKDHKPDALVALRLPHGEDARGTSGGISGSAWRVAQRRRELGALPRAQRAGRLDRDKPAGGGKLDARDDEVFATPVPADGELFVRTRSALYNFVK